MRLNAIIAVVTLLLGCALSLSGWAQDPFQPTLITLHAKQQPLTEVLKEISRQAGVEVAVARGSETSAEREKVTANFDAQPFWVVLRGICPPGWGPEYAQNEAPIVLRSVGSGVSQFRSVPICTRDGLTVAATGTYQQSDFSKPPTSKLRAFALQMQVYVDPKLRVLQAWQQMTIERAVTENGGVLEPAQKERGRLAVGFGPAWRWHVSADLLAPRDASLRIAELKGRMKFVVEEASESWQIDDPANAIGASREIAITGEKATVQAFRKKDERSYELVLRYDQTTRPNPDEPRPSLFKNSISFPLYRISATDAAGVEYDKFGGGGSWTNTGTMSAEILFSAQNRKGEDLGPPARIVISLPTKVREVEVPVEFKDLPMP